MAPPPPAVRYSPRVSPGRSVRGGDAHKRGRSLESGLSFKGKEDDVGLALFEEMQKKEHDTFLLESNDDLDDLFGTKLKYFSDCKIGLNVSTRGGSSDMLNADGEKHDYDWLLTPPDTPLFSSLDDEAPPGNLVQRGRPRSLPIPITRSSTMEKNYKGRSSRGSPSPQRFSPSPRPGTGSSQQSRGRTSPAPSSSPTASVRSSSPSRRPSPPSLKFSTSAPRSSTQTPRRLSTGSSGTGAAMRGRDRSPVQSSRVISSSPKVSSWQSNIPGFSTEVPPNLRTSLADRPATYVRGSSPASRNGKDASVKVKLSMSPTERKSITSSNIDRERLSSHSKGSIISSGDDEAESLNSIPFNTSDFSRRVGTQSNNKALSYSRKPNKMVLSSSAPKRSFDNALRHMDQRKTQNMFRPLLSSVPTTTLYAGKPMSAHEAMLSKNSSMTTSSTASSDQAFGHTPEMVERYTHQETVTQYEDKPDTDVPEMVFVLDKMDVLHSDAVTEIDSFGNQRGVVDDGFVNATEHGIDENFSYNGLITALGAMSKVKSNENEDLEEGTPGDLTLCSECGCKYSSMYIALNEVNLCPECSRKDINLQICHPEKTVAEVYSGLDLAHPDKDYPQIEPDEYPSLSPSLALTSRTESRGFQHNDNSTIRQPSFEANSNSPVDNTLGRSLVEEGDRRHIDPQKVCHKRVVSNQHETEDASQFMSSKDTSSSYFNDSEVDGISILLKQSSSSKGPLYQGRVFKASSIPYDDPSYARESGSYTRSSMGLGSTSASSSVDLSSSRQTETRIQRQPSNKKIETDSYGLKRTGSHSSETSNHAYQTSCHSMNTHEDESGVCYDKYMEKKILCVQEQFQALGSEEMHEVVGSRTSSFKEVQGCNIFTGGSSVTSNDEKSALYEHGEGIEKINTVTDESMLPSESEPDEDLPLQKKCSDATKAVVICTHRSLHSVSEIENEPEQVTNPDSVNDHSPTKLDAETPMLSAANLPEKVETIYVEEVDPYNDEHGASESAVVIKVERGNHARSLTLEEATDTILFCRSLVQNIVDQAATIAIEKESSLLSEPPRPILAKTNPQQTQTWGRSPHNKHTQKSNKPKQKRTQTEDPKPHSSKFENDENVEQAFPRNVGLPTKPNAATPPKLESKCNCTIM